MELDELLQKRRAYRSLTKVDITDSEIQELARAARLSPSCFNNQPWNYVFVRDVNKLKKIVKTMPAGNQSWAKDASMIIGVFAKKDDDCVVGEREYYLFDTGLATQNILLKATELDLVGHPIAGYDKEKSREIMNIPAAYQLITLIIVGKKAEEINQNLSESKIKAEKKRPARKKLNEFIFYENFRG